ncbi:Phosphatidylinositol 4-phosphate 5-kinase its3 [Trametes pubescens]|uniref:Phosphatidylinositol 4-phosphate 5-kinase its3 n=1 Tax=Trametes pubescens TaxID=154538 RepID=A0A1M2VBJ5_TRAPU|nr:Phosphatidylinositol 4-phosphate 5-kinase its3 [Trametes pubescens]
MAATATIPIARTSSPNSFDDRQRQSYASTSHTSYLTAPLGSPQSPIHPSSRDSDSVNPIHSLAFAGGKQSPAQEVHILKVTDNVVEIGEGPVPEPFLHKVGASLAHAVPTFHRGEQREGSADFNVGPPPPSPPSSVEDDGPPPAPRKQQLASVESSPRPITFEEPLQRTSSGSRTPSSFARFSSSSQGLRHRSSAETRSSLRTASQSGYGQSSALDTPVTDDLSYGTPTVSKSLPTPTQAGSHVSVDGYLQPPVPHKPSRRNTIGSATIAPNQSPPRPTRTMTMQPHQATIEDVGELADDIELQAEQIRRERMSKRAKAQQEAERALTRSTTVLSRVEDKPLVGNLIGEDHVNYVLIVGNELTPSAKYDFKFKDYAPWVFRELREDYFHLDPADYLLSLTAKYILSELGSPGKSGSFFYFSRDYRFIIKTIHHNEHKFLRRILPQYYAHVKDNPHTLLSRFYGLHRVKLPHGRKIHFVIMNNLFPAHKDVHESYDLKGSTVGREYPEEKAAQNPRAVLKDLNWIKRRKTLELGPEKRALLTEQLRRDSDLLKELGVMDYSLLVGIHSMRRGNRDNVRRNTLRVFSPDMPVINRKKTIGKGPQSPEAIAMRRIMREADPQRLGTITLPEEDTGERQHFLFYQDEGGLRATDEANENMDTIYYLGVIDILTPYNTFKKLEHFWKGLSADRHKISPVPPAEYSSRFFSFMKAIMRGGGGGERFVSDS